MAIRKIRVMGDEVLRKTSKEVKEMTPRLKTLVGDMFDTMYEAMGQNFKRSKGNDAQTENSGRRYV